MNRCKVCKEEPQDCICRSSKNRSLLDEADIKPLREQIFGPGIDINNQIKVFMELCLIAQHLKTRICNNEEWVEWIEKEVGLAITHTEWENRKREIYSEKKSNT